MSPLDTVESIADRIERLADRYANAGNSEIAELARNSARFARSAHSVEAARRIESELLNRLGNVQSGAPESNLGNSQRQLDDEDTVATGGILGWFYRLLGMRNRNRSNDFDDDATRTSYAETNYDPYAAAATGAYAASASDSPQTSAPAPDSPAPAQQGYDTSQAEDAHIVGGRDNS